MTEAPPNEENRPATPPTGSGVATSKARPGGWFIALVLLVPSVMLVQLQHDATNHVPANIDLLAQYFTGHFRPQMFGSSAMETIVEARCLMRGLLMAAMALHPGGLRALAFNNFVLQTAFVWGALGFIYTTARRHMAAGWALAAALLAVVSVPWGFLIVGNQVSYAYDLPAMFFAALGVAAVTRGRFDWMLLTVAAGTLNKETVVYLIPAYVLAEWPSHPRKGKLLTQAAVLAVLFAVAYEEPRWLLQADHPQWATFTVFIEPGAPRWQENLIVLGLRAYGSEFQNVYWVMLLYLPGLVSFRRLPWRWRAVYLATPVFLVPIFLAGNIWELRLYNDLIPLGALSCAFVLSRRLPDLEEGTSGEARPGKAAPVATSCEPD